jgi:hypothetical protein
MTSNIGLNDYTSVNSQTVGSKSIIVSRSADENGGTEEVEILKPCLKCTSGVLITIDNVFSGGNPKVQYRLIRIILLTISMISLFNFIYTLISYKEVSCDICDKKDVVKVLSTEINGDLITAISGDKILNWSIEGTKIKNGSVMDLNGYITSSLSGGYTYCLIRKSTFGKVNRYVTIFYVTNCLSQYIKMSNLYYYLDGSNTTHYDEVSCDQYVCSKTIMSSGNSMNYSFDSTTGRVSADTKNSVLKSIFTSYEIMCFGTSNC